jgi:hypothetical protein
MTNPAPRPGRPPSPRPWRTGTKVFRTIYDANDTLIGMMDTPEDAALVVKAVNAEATSDGAPPEGEATP